jgi:two-component system LytT family response regulator
MKYVAIIIDDEPKARQILQTLLEENCPEINIVAQAEDVPSGVKAINQHKPAIVFSDIDMPSYNGFQLLEFVDKANFELIYCTGHDEFALRAFEVSAVDYLLKPIQISQLVNAVNKAIKLCNSNTPQTAERFDTLRENLKDSVLKKIALPVADGLIFIDIDDLMYLEADGAYTNVFLNDGNKLLISKKLKEFENILTNNKNFFRTHRSYIINTSCIKQYIKSDGGSIVLQNKVSIPIARERKEEFQTYIENIKI